MIAALPQDHVAERRFGSLDPLIGYLLRRAELRMMADLSESLTPLELRPQTFSILVVIADNPGVIQSQVCEILGIKHANFAPIAAELESLGFVDRLPSAVDRRQVELRLTAEGTRMLRRAWRVVSAQEERMAKVLGPSGKRRILGLLRTLIDDFERTPAAGY